jgi:hypothetical protein
LPPKDTLPDNANRENFKELAAFAKESLNSAPLLESWPTRQPKPWTRCGVYSPPKTRTRS